LFWYTTLKAQTTDVAPKVTHARILVFFPSTYRIKTQKSLKKISPKITNHQKNCVFFDIKNHPNENCFTVVNGRLNGAPAASALAAATRPGMHMTG